MVQSAESERVTCPLDESHRILKGRMQFHLVKCLKNHNLGMRLKCPWNPLHIIDKFVYKDHYTRECEDMPGAFEFMFTTEESRDVGSVPVDATNNLLPPSEEDWDAQPGPVGTYDPIANAEGQLVVRRPIGLSKAKRKAFRLAERRRFQSIEANGPIQTASRPPEPEEAPKALRKPRNAGLVLSTDASMIDELNASKNSADDNKSTKSKKKQQILRTPFNPCSALTYQASSSMPGNRSITSDDESYAIENPPNLRHMFGSSLHDTASRRSGASSSCTNVDAIRKDFERSIQMANSGLTEPENSSLLDEAACLPAFVTPIADSETESVFELSQRFAALTTQQQEIEKAKNIVRQKLSRYNQLPNLVSSSAATLSRSDLSHDDGQSTGPTSSIDNFSLVSEPINNGIPKCAANFPKLARRADRPAVGIGRGMVNALDQERNCGPPGYRRYANNQQDSPNRERIEQFEAPLHIAGGKTSQRTYAQSAASADAARSTNKYEKSE